jgi:folate-binding protein YgfZ
MIKRRGSQNMMKTLSPSFPLAGILPAPVWRSVVVRGEKGRLFLNRILTQKLDDLGEGEVRPALLLDHRGRLVSGGYSFLSAPEEVTFVIPDGFEESFQRTLELYRLRERIEIARGPHSFLLWIEPPYELLPSDPYRLLETAEGVSLRVIYTGAPEILWSGPFPQGGETASPEFVEALRIEGRIPAFGKEWTPGVIPSEALREEWIHPKKGCYVGQEVIERLRSRNRFARILVRYRIEEVPPSLPCNLKGELGVITSAVSHPRLGPIALGYLSTRYDPATPLLTEAGKVVEIWEEDLELFKKISCES